MPPVHEFNLRRQCDFLESRRGPGISYAVAGTGPTARLMATLTSPNGKHVAQVDLQGAAVMSFTSDGRELFYVSPTSDYRAGAVARGGDQTGICTFGKRSGDHLPPHFVGRQAMYRVWQPPSPTAATSTELSFHVDSSSLTPFLPSDFLTDRSGGRTVEVTKSVRVADDGTLRIALKQRTHGVRADLFLHPYMANADRTPIYLEGLSGMRFEELDLSKGQVPFSHPYSSIELNPTLLLERPMMRLYELPTEVAKSGVRLSYAQQNKTEVLIHFAGCSHIVIWRPSDAQFLADISSGAERDSFVCIEPVSFDRREDVSGPMTKVLTAEYRFS